MIYLQIYVRSIIVLCTKPITAGVAEPPKIPKKILKQNKNGAELCQAQTKLGLAKPHYLVRNLGGINIKRH